MAQYEYLKKDFLVDQIRRRYSPDSILPYMDNLMAHALVREEFTRSTIQGMIDKFKEKNPDRPVKLINSNITGMSLKLGSFFESDESEFIDGDIVTDILTKKELMPTKEDLQKIKEKNIKLAFVGLGGAMMNTINVLKHFAIKHSEVGLFDKVIVFEKDTIDFTNLFRFGKPILFKQVTTRSSVYGGDDRQTTLLKKLHMLDDEKIISKENKLIIFDEYLTEKHTKVLDDRGYTLIGAPDIETRNKLANSNFYFLGHHNYEVDLAHRQEAIDDIVLETYGSVDIPVLLINLTIATCALIKDLASDEPKTETERMVLRFDLKKYLEGEV